VPSGIRDGTVYMAVGSYSFPVCPTIGSDGIVPYPKTTTATLPRPVSGLTLIKRKEAGKIYDSWRKTLS